MTNPRLLPTASAGDVDPWEQALYAFLIEKGNRSGSRRTVEGYGRMLRPFFRSLGKTADQVTPADVLSWSHGIGLSGRTPSATTVGARIACLSSYFRFLIRMRIATSNPCDALERPKSVPSVARGLSADEVRRLLAAVPDTIAGRRDGHYSSRSSSPAGGGPRWSGSRPATSASRTRRPSTCTRARAASGAGESSPVPSARRSSGRSPSAARTSRPWTRVSRSGRLGPAVPSVYLRRLEGETDLTWQEVASAIGV